MGKRRQHAHLCAVGKNLPIIISDLSHCSFFPEPPEEDGIEQKFRSLPSDEALKLSPSVRYLVRSATATQMDLRDLHENNFPDSFRKFIERVDIHKRNPQILATEVRKIIGVTLQQQFGWRSEEVAIKNWRTAIENFGIWVFKRAFKDDSCCGFCLNDAHFPVIYVNNSMSKRRQIFTLFHELSHLITDTEESIFAPTWRAF